MVLHNRTNWIKKCIQDTVDHIQHKRVLHYWNQWECACWHRWRHICNLTWVTTSEHERTPIISVYILLVLLPGPVCKQSTSKDIAWTTSLSLTSPKQLTPLWCGSVNTICHPQKSGTRIFATGVGATVTLATMYSLPILGGGMVTQITIALSSCFNLLLIKQNIGSYITNLLLSCYNRD